MGSSEGELWGLLKVSDESARCVKESDETARCVKVSDGILRCVKMWATRKELQSRLIE